MRVLLTGACGFIGSHFVEAILKTTSWTVIGLDRIDETSSLERIRDTRAYQSHRERFEFVWHDLRSPINASIASAIGNIDIVLHLAASTHVDRSIADPPAFVMDNVLGTAHLLEWARQRQQHELRQRVKLFVNFSTDEVFGSAPDGVAFAEEDPFRPGNPYAASKAAAVELVESYANTYNVPIVTTFCMNVIGERQHPEKYLPLLVRKILIGEMVTIHADPTRTKPARRNYIHARNVWNVIYFLLNEDTPLPARINIAGDRETDCLELAEMVAEILGKPLHYAMVDFHSSRPGHDLRYALTGTRLADLGFHQPVTFSQSLERTVKWFERHPSWLGLGGAELSKKVGT